MIKWLLDIRFWLGVTGVHRLFSIMQPPLEVAHNWRQTTVCMVARNFLEVDANIFYPRVDMAGNLSGITGMEFPLLNYLIYLISLVFGYEHWYGRLVNLIVSSVGIYAFHEVIEKHFDPRVAFNASLVLLFSLFYYYSRKIMPDTFSVSLIFMGIWAWNELSERWHFGRFMMGFVLVMLGVLSKLPAVLVLAFALPIFIGATKRTKGFIAIAVGASGVVAALWYFYWMPHLEQTYGFHHFFMGQGISNTVNVLLHNWQDTLVMFYQKALGYSGFIAFCGGLVFMFKAPIKMRWIVVVSVLLFVGLMLKSGDKFTNHEYYILPFVPVMALISGYFLSQFNNRYVMWTFLVIIMVEGVVRKWEDQFIKSAGFIEHLDESLDPYCSRDDLIVVNSGNLPTPLYFAHRKGWLASNEDLQHQDFIDNLKEKGCSHVLILKERFGVNVNLDYRIEANSQDFTLYEL